MVRSKVFLCVISLISIGCTESAEYVTTTMKNVNGILPNRAANFIIPDGQCNGYIDQTQICINQVPAAVQVQVEDNIAYPNVLIDNSLLSTTIQRAPSSGGSCAGEAGVQLSYNCFQGRPPIRQRRSPRLLPPGPVH